MKGEGHRLVPEWFLQLTRTGTICVPVLMMKNMHFFHPDYSSSEGSGNMLNREVAKCRREDENQFLM